MTPAPDDTILGNRHVGHNPTFAIALVQLRIPCGHPPSARTATLATQFITIANEVRGFIYISLALPQAIALVPI